MYCSSDLHFLNHYAIYNTRARNAASAPGAVKGASTMGSGVSPHDALPYRSLISVLCSANKPVYLPLGRDI